MKIQLSVVLSALLFSVPLSAQITGVTAGTDLTGGGTSGNVTLNLDTSKVPRLAAGNSFTGNQTITGQLNVSGAVTAGSFNIGGNPFAFGSFANSNSFLGFAGNSTSTGIQNVGIGVDALLTNTSGQWNTATGAFALQGNTTGGVNTAIGRSALGQNTNGSANTATGADALTFNAGGSFNTAGGAEALETNTNGYYNTAFGASAGYSNLTGWFNTYLGFNAGPSTDPLTNAAAIGANATVGVSNAMILGGTSINSVTVAIGTSTPFDDYALDVDTTKSNGIINGGVVVNASGGNLYLGMTKGVHKFRVDTNGVAYSDGGFVASGADFAESVAVRGPHARYEPGDVLEIDQEVDGQLAISHHAYATTVAGIYSTKPGLLASPRTIDDPAPKANEVPLAVIGIVPCKVTAENGPISRGDLLVTSSRPGYAMKGTDRERMLGAVVGKALETLTGGKGVIHVLVTLQ